MNQELLATITIQHNEENTYSEESCKKIASGVDNCRGFSKKLYQTICQIQEFLKEGCSYREIAKRMGVGRNTIAKYRQGNPMELSMYGVSQSKLDPFYYSMPIFWME